MGTKPSEGYFKTYNTNGSNGRKISETVALSKENDILIPAVYKNNSQPSANNDSIAILADSSSVFTELIKLGFPKTQQYIDATSSESGIFIENLIYANLRIQRLIEQYNQLHKDAEYFQKRHLQPMTETEIIVKNERKRSNSLLATTALDKISSEYDSLSSKFDIPSKTIDIKRSGGLDNFDPVGNITTGTKVYKNPFQTYSPQPFNRTYTPRAVNKAEIQSQQEKTTEEQIPGDRAKRPPVRTSEMPWMIRFVVSLVDYFVHNKIEGLIYLGMIIIAVSIITGGKR